MIERRTGKSSARWLMSGVVMVGLGPGLAVAMLATDSNRTPAAAESAASATEWPLLGGNSDQWQYSSLADINEQTVKRLGLAWVADFPIQSGLTGNPLVADGIVYDGAPGGKIFAHDVRTGKEVWRFTPELPYPEDTSLVSFWATHFNRGLAIDKERAFISTGDCRLFAVDRKSGKRLWQTLSCDPKTDLGIEAAPRVGGGKVFVGNTNCERGTARGFVDAFDAATGKHLWRFYTIPGDPAKGFENKTMEMASKTWGTGPWKYNSVNPWEGITYDEKLDLVYIGTGNPEPQNPALRARDAGDELFSDSIVALRASTGEYVWHYQATPHDGWGGDATAPITIAELTINGKPHRVLLQASKNAFFYVLDAKTGRLISGDKYAPNNWATGVDPNTGKLIVPDSSRYWEHPNQTTVIQPGGMGAHGWELMAYSPLLHLVYIPAFILPNLIEPTPAASLVSDRSLYQSMEARRRDREYGQRPDAMYKTMGKLIAWDPIARREIWHVDQPLPVNGGVLATAGNLVFQGTADGRFAAYAADTGKEVWSFATHSTVLAAPSTVRVGGEQYILISIGNGASTSAGQTLPYLTGRPDTRGPSRLLAFKLGGGAGEIPGNSPALIPKPSTPRQPVELAARGNALYLDNGCVMCHGLDAIGGGGEIADLRKSSPETLDHMHDIVVDGRFRSLGMPGFPNLSEQDLTALRALITNAAWDGYEEQTSAKK
jgi:PQQ-dependent dehydrogenase (methanol/ethanol family)